MRSKTSSNARSVSHEFFFIYIYVDVLNKIYISYLFLSSMPTRFQYIQNNHMEMHWIWLKTPFKIYILGCGQIVRDL